MRIISGKYKGKILSGYNIEGTRPTMDRVKESVIATIQNHIFNSVSLDLFAGSGSVGYELLSNGGNTCYFVDNNIKVIDGLNKTKKELNEQSAIIMKKDYKDALTYFKDNNISFDIIYLDPPYKLNYINPSLRLIDEYGLLKDDGIIVLEYETEVIDYSGYEEIKQKKYGSKLVSIIKKISE